MKKKLLSIITFCLLTLGLYAKSTSALRIPFTLIENVIIFNMFHEKDTYYFKFNFVPTDCLLYKSGVQKTIRSYFNDERDLKEILIETYMKQENVEYSEAEKSVAEILEKYGANGTDLEFSIGNRIFSNRSFSFEVNHSSDENIDGYIGPSFFTNVDNIFIDYKESYIEINSQIKGKNSVPLYNMSGEKDPSIYSPLYILAELNGIQQPFIISSFPLSVSRQDIYSSYIYKGEEFQNIVNDSTEINLENNTDFEPEIKIGNTLFKMHITKYSDKKIKCVDKDRKIFQLYNSLGNDFFKDKRILVDYKHKKFYIW